jgi:PAS domain S-box-containing protein
LSESEEKHRNLIENSNNIIYTLSPDGVLTFVSPSWTRLLGHPVDHVVGRPFQSFVHPDDLAMGQASLQRVIETKQRMTGAEVRMRHADGSWRWQIINAVPLMDGTGKVIGIEGSATDITEKKQVEEALKQGEKRYHLLVDSATEAIIVAQDGMLRLVNPITVVITGLSEQELMSKPFTSLIHPDDRAMVVESYQKRVRGEAVPDRYNFRLLNNGKDVPLP